MIRGLMLKLSVVGLWERQGSSYEQGALDPSRQCVDVFFQLYLVVHEYGDMKHHEICKDFWESEILNKIPCPSLMEWL